MPADHVRATAVPLADPRRLVLLPSCPGTAPRQQAFLSACAELLPKAAASGDRLVTALYLILLAHAAAPAGDGPDSHLSCVECRPERREAAARYPCPTAQQAFWALDAILR
jgi:hypothetical protein